MEQKSKILIVDDSADDRFFLQHALVKTGMSIERFEAQDGEEAVDFLSHAERFSDAQRFPRPDLIFLDLKMPGMDGFDVLRWIRQYGGEPPLRVVILSGSELESDISLAYELGAVAYLTKPATPAQLREVIQANLGLPASVGSTR